ncbi:MAG: phage late control D family protein [Spirochaetales bacterium]|nr:phage late control D family protein [Spirochaetales bacterium]
MGLKQSDPTFIIYLNGTRLSVEQEGAVKQVIINDRINVPSSCSIVLSDTAKMWMDDSSFEEGVGVSVHLGYKDDIDEVFNGEVVGMDVQFRKGAGTTTVVKCLNVIHRLRRVKKHRIFSEMTDGDIFNEIASENGLSLDIDDIGGDKLFVIQKDITDYEFLLSAAMRYGCKLWAKEKKLFFKAENEENSEEIIVEWGKSLKDFSAQLDTSNIITEVSVTGWDNDKGESFTGTIAFGDVPPVGGSTLGGDSVESNFGAAAVSITDEKVLDQSEAEKLALDMISSNSFNFIRGNGACNGNFMIKAGCLLTVKEVGGKFSGEYLVEEARHVLNASTGYTTYFSVMRNAC